MTDVVDAAKLLATQTQREITAENKADNEPSKSTSKKAAPANASAVTAASAARTERAPAADEGARAFGTPMGTETERQRAAQSTDAAN
jgi:predicted cobalt transporter CbtA